MVMFSHDTRDMISNFAQLLSIHGCIYLHFVQYALSSRMLRPLVKPDKLLAYEILRVDHGNRLHYLRQHSEALPSMLRTHMYLSLCGWFHSRRTEQNRTSREASLVKLQPNYIQHIVEKNVSNDERSSPQFSACKITLRMARLIFLRS